MAIEALTTTRRDGHLREPRTLARYLKRRGWPTTIATGEQVHRAKISIVPALTKHREYAGVDGLITTVENQPLGIFTADCVPVFLSARGGDIVGVLHAGWRGVQGKILERAARLLYRRWRIHPREIRAWMGPFIGPCCFEVRWDVARHFPGARRRSTDRWMVDLGRALRRQATALGIHWAQPAAPGCTMHGKHWHSYRRDQTAYRQVSLIRKTPPVR